MSALLESGEQLLSHAGRRTRKGKGIRSHWFKILDRTFDVEGSTCETEQRVDYGMDALGEVSVTGLCRQGSRCGAETPE